jgi:hypothetical protein
MLLFGTKTTKLTVEPISDICANCGTQHTMDAHIFQKYFHFFFIPLFPIKKTGTSLCTHCKQVLRQREMPRELKRSFDKVKRQIPMPVWTWAGVALLAAFIAASAMI